MGHLRATCQVDMSMSSPYRHESGDLSRWCCAVTNKKHTAGGKYMERGGSLSAKTLATFVDAGLNASLIRKPVNADATDVDASNVKLPRVMSATTANFNQDSKCSFKLQMGDATKLRN